MLLVNIIIVFGIIGAAHSIQDRYGFGAAFSFCFCILAGGLVAASYGY